jgi:hypothetical protein
VGENPDYRFSLANERTYLACGHALGQQIGNAPQSDAFVLVAEAGPTRASSVA